MWSQAWSERHRRCPRPACSLITGLFSTKYGSFFEFYWKTLRVCTFWRLSAEKHSNLFRGYGFIWMFQICQHIILIIEKLYSSMFRVTRYTFLGLKVWNHRAYVHIWPHLVLCMAINTSIYLTILLDIYSFDLQGADLFRNCNGLWTL